MIILKAVKYLYHLPKQILSYLRSEMRCSSLLEEYRIMKENGRQTAILISTPEHGNLGDQAIVYAEKSFFKKYFPEWNVLEIPASVFCFCSRRIQKGIDQKALIVIDGGGNIGTLWVEVEYKMQKIIQLFPKNPIVIFPETAYFDTTQAGRNLLRESISAYQSHQNLLVSLRDQKSYDLFQKEYAGVHSMLIPDIVLFLDKTGYASQHRDGILLCFRDDIEASLSDEKRQKIIQDISDQGKKYDSFSTHIYRDVVSQTRNEFLASLWSRIGKAEWVVTDRLHAMIFSAITGTPCIAFDNANGKVHGVYKTWLRHYSNIHIADTIDEMKEIMKMPQKDGKNDSLETYYLDFAKKIKALVGEK